LNSCTGISEDYGGGKMQKEYKVKFYDDSTCSFVHILQNDLKCILTSGDWIEERALESGEFIYVYRKLSMYLSIFHGDESGIITESKSLLERINKRELVFFNPDDDFTQLHFMQLLGKPEIEIFTRNHDMQRIEMEGISSEYTKYYKVHDGRILSIISSCMAELFMNENEIYTLRKMEASASINTVVIPDQGMIERK
jgi:hypothetical protein